MTKFGWPMRLNAAGRRGTSRGPCGSRPGRTFRIDRSTVPRKPVSHIPIGRAAVDGNHRPADIGCAPRDEEGDHIGDFVRSAHAAERQVEVALDIAPTVCGAEL